MPNTSYPAVCVHELFEAQAARTPAAVAVVWPGGQLNYRELNERANRLAHHLRRRGVGHGALVGVCIERSPQLVIGLLGAWKAGAAYVPLDPAYPAERLSFMLEDADVRMLLTDGRSRRLFPSVASQTLCLDLHGPLIAHESASNPALAVSPSDLAYVMYTSGSTGQPKGAMILHSGLVNYLCWAIDAYAVKAGDSVPVHSSISFDLTVTSLYPALLAGGQVELLPEEAGASSLVTALRQGKGRGLVKITPAHLALLSQQLRPEEVAGMTKVFVIGGENLLAEHLRVWREFAPETRLINEYGPTEAVVGCCVYEVRNTDPHHGPVPIGRPIANTQLHVLDADRQPVPAGEVGELYIGGAGVARGYLNRPELTQDRFVIDPFSGTPGARLYKTGDLARCRRDGTLEYLGRMDEQVKVRGYRIEPGEIEHALTAHPDVQSCVVLAREDDPGNQRLVAYVIAGKGASPTARTLHEFARQRLPEFMTPAQFVFLDAFPLTYNGKVDRKALPAPSGQHTPESRPFVAPRTQTETTLAGVWSGLLEAGRIGIHDNVFDLGAHSLLAMRAVMQIRALFNVDLQLRNLFERPTVAELAEAIDGLAWLAHGAAPAGAADGREEIAL
ncbi:MAG TPA: amino acid adenylation domain-containing protein [Burkholderiales bacterium]|nr:amino acid adenylation domain-containing protein [Burkholderiales bacterium]